MVSVGFWRPGPSGTGPETISPWSWIACGVHKLAILRVIRGNIE